MQLHAINMTTQIQRSTWANDLRPPTRYWILLLIPLVMVMAFAIFQPIQVLPRYSLAPAYALIDQDGNRLTSEDLRGSLTFYTFTHSDCENPCVPTTKALAAIQPALSQLDLNGIPLRFVTIYVDSDKATPNKLQTIANNTLVNNPEMDIEQWSFVSGDANQLKNIIGVGFRTYYAQDAQGNFAVDPVYALVDGWGILRATYRTSAPDIDLLRRDLGLIAQEVRNSTGISRYAYEAAHLFMCYPK